MPSIPDQSCRPQRLLPPQQPHEQQQVQKWVQQAPRRALFLLSSRLLQQEGRFVLQGALTNNNGHGLLLKMPSCGVWLRVSVVGWQIKHALRDVAQRVMVMPCNESMVLLLSFTCLYGLVLLLEGAPLDLNKAFL